MADRNIFHALKQDHDRHRLLLDKIEDASGDDDRRKKLVAQFRVEVTAHAAAEEETLYAAMLARPELREDARHSVAEHKEIDDRLEGLDELPFGGEAWARAFGALRDRYLHHIDEEEQEMFINAAADLNEAEEAELARLFARRMPAELVRAER